MDLTLQPTESGLLATLSGRLDHEGALAVQERLKSLVGSAGDALVLDLSALETISSEGVRVLISLGQRARQAGLPLAFCGLTGLVREVFDISGLFQVFAVARTPEQAFLAVRRG